MYGVLQQNVSNAQFENLDYEKKLINVKLNDPIGSDTKLQLGVFCTILTIYIWPNT